MPPHLRPHDAVKAIRPNDQVCRVFLALSSTDDCFRVPVLDSHNLLPRVYSLFSTEVAVENREQSLAFQKSDGISEARTYQVLDVR